MVVRLLDYCSNDHSIFLVVSAMVKVNCEELKAIGMLTDRWIFTKKIEWSFEQ